MHYTENCTYHIYNRSNQILFNNRENYLFFIRKMRRYILPFADIISYCLMPNHFHIIINVNSQGADFFTNERVKELQYIARAIGTVQSSYSQALNIQNGTKGSVFSHRVKAKILNEAKNDYALKCFLYVHQNPLTAKLVEKIEDWEFSSYPEYINIRKGTLVNVKLGCEIFNIDQNQILYLTNNMIQEDLDLD